MTVDAALALLAAETTHTDADIHRAFQDWQRHLAERIVEEQAEEAEVMDRLIPAVEKLFERSDDLRRLRDVRLSATELNFARRTVAGAGISKGDLETLVADAPDKAI